MVWSILLKRIFSGSVKLYEIFTCLLNLAGILRTRRLNWLYNMAMLRCVVSTCIYLGIASKVFLKSVSMVEWHSWGKNFCNGPKLCSITYYFWSSRPKGIMIPFYIVLSFKSSFPKLKATTATWKGQSKVRLFWKNYKNFYR